MFHAMENPGGRLEDAALFLWTSWNLERPLLTFVLGSSPHSLDLGIHPGVFTTLSHSTPADSRTAANSYMWPRALEM